MNWFTNVIRYIISQEVIKFIRPILIIILNKFERKMDATKIISPGTITELLLAPDLRSKKKIEANSSSEYNTTHKLEVPLCVAATTGNILLDGSITTVDGVTLNTGDLVLVWQQDDATQNAPYTVNLTGDWIKFTPLKSTMIVAVNGGTDYVKKLFMLTSDNVSIGNDIVFEQITAEDKYVKVSSADTTANYLYDKINVVGLSKEIINDGGNEQVQLTANNEGVIQKFTITGNGVLTQFDITHNLNTVEIGHEAYLALTNETVILGSVIRTSLNEITINTYPYILANGEQLFVLIWSAVGGNSLPTGNVLLKEYTLNAANNWTFNYDFIGKVVSINAIFQGESYVEDFLTNFSYLARFRSVDSIPATFNGIDYDKYLWSNDIYFGTNNLNRYQDGNNYLQDNYYYSDIDNTGLVDHYQPQVYSKDFTLIPYDGNSGNPTDFTDYSNYLDLPDIKLYIYYISDNVLDTEQIQSDWNQTDNMSVDYIKNKPTNLSPSGTNDQTLRYNSSNELEVNPKVLSYYDNDGSYIGVYADPVVPNKYHNYINAVAYATSSYVRIESTANCYSEIKADNSNNSQIVLSGGIADSGNGKVSDTFSVYLTGTENGVSNSSINYKDKIVIDSVGKITSYDLKAPTTEKTLLMSDDTGLIQKLTDGTANHVLTTDGAGNYSFTNKFGDATNNTTFEADGTLVFNGTATTFDDLLPSSITTGGGANVPTFTVYNTGNLRAYEFGGTGGIKELNMGFQIPHAYKLGSDILPHIHLYIPDAGSGGVIRFGCEYTWANIDQTGTINTTTIYGRITRANNAGIANNIILAFNQDINGNAATVSGTGKGISSIFMCRIFRDPGDSVDTFTSSVWLKSADIHVERDSLGSHSEYTK